jgi:RNA polymerase sigma factor (sigma-70 family)
MTETLQQWFVREILVHEPALMRYISRAWPDRSECHDIRQEAYAKVYESASVTRPTNPRSYLFTITRNLILDRLRRGKIVSIEVRGDLDELNVLIDEMSPERMVGARQELRRLIRAFELLPPLCREIVWKRRVEELSQKEVAQGMGIKEKAVERGIARGIRLLAESYFAGGAGAEPADNVNKERDNYEHG